MSSFGWWQYLWKWKQTASGGGKSRKVQAAEWPRSRLCVTGVWEGFLPKKARSDGAAFSRAGAPGALWAPGPRASAGLGSAGLGWARRGWAGSPQGPASRKEGRKRITAYEVWEVTAFCAGGSCVRLPEDNVWLYWLIAYSIIKKKKKFQLMGAPPKQTRYGFHHAVPVEKSIILH